MLVTLRKQVVKPVALPDERDRAFGLVVYGALIQLAKAFYRRYVGGEPKCSCQK